MEKEKLLVQKLGEILNKKYRFIILNDKCFRIIEQGDGSRYPHTIQEFSSLEEVYVWVNQTFSKIEKGYLEYLQLRGEIIWSRNKCERMR